MERPSRKVVGWGATHQIQPSRMGALALALLAACSGGKSGSSPGPGATAAADDARLRALIAEYGIVAQASPAVPDAQFSLGLQLFQSTLLSGNRRVSCSSCHPIGNAGMDNLALAIGVDGTGSPPDRYGTPVIHRNTPDLLNLGLPQASFMFWDGRVSRVGGVFTTPAGAALPAGLSGPLAAQALFPILSRTEMLGQYDLSDDNDLADLNPPGEVVDQHPQAVWAGIVARLCADKTIAPMLLAAYPGKTLDQISIVDVANALAAFQTRRWNDLGSTNQLLAYAAGRRGITDDQRKGGLLFFGDAGCVRCHDGPLLTDQKFHVMAVPQIGPGFGSGALLTPPRDLGRYEVTGQDADRYAFLTPSLWEVVNTAPYMHDGIYATLEDAVRHQLDPAGADRSFSCAGAPSPAGNVVSCTDSASSAASVEEVVARLDPLMATPLKLDDEQVGQLVAFLSLLTDGNNNSR